MSSSADQVLIGVTGGIAAYKTATVVSRLAQQGVSVSVVMTRSATELVAPKTFEALSSRPVRVELFEEPGHAHIDAAREAHVFCIAPATANCLAKAATGMADDLLSTLILSFDGRILLAPAMNHVMWKNGAVQRNIHQLIQDGHQIILPEEGHLSCGESGLGRMAEPETILAAIRTALDQRSAREV
jgi:phosphopantothenoylcysteine decarboxylase/phosphopantothenate--cysteine ligase